MADHYPVFNAISLGSITSRADLCPCTHHQLNRDQHKGAGKASLQIG